MKNVDLIDKYFENNLSPKEQLLFNDLLHSDEEFKSEFVFQKDLKKVISLNQMEDLKSTLQGFEKDISNKSKIFFLPKKWLVAASIILLVGFGFWFINNTYFPSNEKLYTQNFEPYRNIVQPVVRGENINSIEYKAFVAYENKNYHKAINLYNSVDNTDADYIQFYKAMCYLSLNKTNEAINLLLPIATSNNKSTSDKNFDELAVWYLGLAYLKIGENEKALSQLSLIANHPTNTFKQENAKKIIEFIN